MNETAYRKVGLLAPNRNSISFYYMICTNLKINLALLLLYPYYAIVIDFCKRAKISDIESHLADICLNAKVHNFSTATTIVPKTIVEIGKRSIAASEEQS